MLHHKDIFMTSVLIICDPLCKWQTCMKKKKENKKIVASNETEKCILSQTCFSEQWIRLRQPWRRWRKTVDEHRCMFEGGGLGGQGSIGSERKFLWLVYAILYTFIKNQLYLDHPDRINFSRLTYDQKWSGVEKTNPDHYKPPWPVFSITMNNITMYTIISQWICYGISITAPYIPIIWWQISQEQWRPWHQHSNLPRVPWQPCHKLNGPIFVYWPEAQTK